MENPFSQQPRRCACKGVGETRQSLLAVSVRRGKTKKNAQKEKKNT